MLCFDLTHVESLNIFHASKLSLVSIVSDNLKNKNYKSISYVNINKAVIL